MHHDDTIHILVIDDSANDAETVANMLRNAGHAVRAERIEDDEDLRNAVKEHDWDMVLAKETPYFTCVDALHAIERLHVDLPLLIISDEMGYDDIMKILAEGARDSVRISRPERLKHTILRELKDVRFRRASTTCEADLEAANRRAQSLVESSRDAIAYVHDGMHIYTNSSYLNMFGYSDFAELEGLPLMNLVVPDEAGKFKDFFRKYMKGKAKENTLEIRGLKADETFFNLTMEFSKASYEGEECTQIIIRDQSINEELAQKLDDLSKQDLLTGVYNRQYFLDSLKGAIDRPNANGAVLYIRPDNFKELRTNIGIAASDGVLADIASVIKGQLSGDNDFVSRFESNIFTVVLCSANEESARNIAEAIRKAVEDHIHEEEGQSVSTTCSIGITLFSSAIKNPQEVINRAEKAFNEVAEKNKVNLFKPKESDLADAEKSAIWDKRIRQALKQNSFRLLFQPIISLHGDATENYEILLRMLDADGNEISPGEFIPAAEKNGLIVAIDRWVLANTVKTLAARRKAGRKSNFFVKLSADSLKDQRLLPWLRDLIKAAKLDANSLTLEVSEAIASNNIKALKMLIDGLKQLHIRLALDHVGKASNYLNLLKHVDADYVKIDGSLISKMNRDTDALKQVQEISSFAKEHEKMVMAEFVEDAQTLATIWTSGVDYIQGHFLQPPQADLNFDFSAAG